MTQSHERRPVLLPEVLPGVIAHLQDNMSSIRACSVTSKAWLDATRPVLFDEVAFDHRAKRTKDLVALLKNPLCTIRPYIRQVCFYSSDPRKAAFLKEALPAIPLLDSVDRVRIMEIDWNSVPRSVRTAICSHFQCTRELYLEDAAFDTLSDFATLLNSFPRLRELRMRNATDGPVRKGSQEGPTSAAVPPCALEELQSLWIRSGVLDKPLQWLATPAVRETLHFVSIVGITSYQYKAISEFLQRAGRAVEELELGTKRLPIFVANAVGQANLPAHNKLIDLTKLTSLRSIAFRKITPSEPFGPFLPAPPNEWNTFIPHAMHALAEGSPNLESARFDVFTNQVKDIHALDWTVIASVPLREITLNIFTADMTCTPEILDREIAALKARVRGGMAHKEIIVHSEMMAPVEGLMSAMRNGSLRPQDMAPIRSAAQTMAGWMSLMNGGNGQPA